MKKDFFSLIKSNGLFIVIGIVVVFLGGLTGWYLAGGDITDLFSRKEGISQMGEKVDISKEAGIADESTFKDTASGLLERGGVNGEGTHHLVREGGPSQYVYLTSTVIDLDAFVGKTVQVWGETIAAQKAGWLMDVGKVKLIE